MGGASEGARTKQARRKLDSLVLGRLAFKTEGETIRESVKSSGRYFATPQEYPQ